MRSAITTAVLATAIFGQAFGARVHRHGHEHLHEKKAEDAGKRSVGAMVTATIDGKVDTWVNEYAGPGVALSSAASSVAAAASSVVTSAAAAAVSTTKKSSKGKTSKTSSAAAASSSTSTSSSGTSSSLTSADKTRLDTMGVLISENPTYSSDSAMGVGSGGPFVLDFTNESDDDIVLVLWSGTGYTAMAVCESTADFTISLAKHESTTISFNPDKASGASISGAFAAIYPDTVINYAGQVGNTWGEFTFVTSSEFSTLDVSRLVEQSGNSLSIQNYQSKGGSSTCLSNMDTCVFVCTDSASPCAYAIENCTVGAAGNTVDTSRQDGGCDYEGTSGYSAVTFS